jgi:hypothetical protein
MDPGGQGARLAFSTGRGSFGGLEILVTSADGSGQRNLTAIPPPTYVLPGRLTVGESPLPATATVTTRSR